MQLTYNNEVIVLNRDGSAYPIILEKVNEIITKEEKVFSHLLVDNVPVYEAHEQYIQEHLDSMNQVTIVAYTVREMIVEIMTSIQDYLERAIPALETLSRQEDDSFPETFWGSIQQLTEGMQWMLQFIETIRESEAKPSHWELIDESFIDCENQFAELLTAIEAKDQTFMIDLLAYGILPAYENLKDHLTNSLANEENLNDAH